MHLSDEATRWMLSTPLEKTSILQWRDPHGEPRMPQAMHRRYFPLLPKNHIVSSYCVFAEFNCQPDQFYHKNRTSNEAYCTVDCCSHSCFFADYSTEVIASKHEQNCGKNHNSDCHLTLSKICYAILLILFLAFLRCASNCIDGLYCCFLRRVRHLAHHKTCGASCVILQSVNGFDCCILDILVHLCCSFFAG